MVYLKKKGKKKRQAGRCFCEVLPVGAQCVSVMFISLLTVVMEAWSQLGDPALHGTGLLTLMHGKLNVLSGSRIFNPEDFTRNLKQKARAL